MSVRFFEYKGQRYDTGTKLIAELPNGTQMETTYLGFGWFENITPEFTEISIVKITQPKYYVETLKRD